MRYSLPIALILAAGMLIGSSPFGAGGVAFAQNYQQKSQEQIAADINALKAARYRFGGQNAATTGNAGQTSNHGGGNRGGGKK